MWLSGPHNFYVNGVEGGQSEQVEGRVGKWKERHSQAAGEHRKVGEPRSFQKTKIDNLARAGVWLENSNVSYLNMNKLRKCLMLENTNSKQPKKIIRQVHHYQE